MWQTKCIVGTLIADVVIKKKLMDIQKMSCQHLNIKKNY